MTHYLSWGLQNPFCSVNCLKKVMTLWVPYLSISGKLISSQNTTNHLLSCLGQRTIPVFVFLYSQYWSNVFNKSWGEVELEKLTKIISKSVKAFKVAIKVIVFPDPGGPQSKNGLCSDNHEHKTSWCLKVSIVVMTSSASQTLIGSMSIVGTLCFHKCQD